MYCEQKLDLRCQHARGMSPPWHPDSGGGDEGVGWRPLGMKGVFNDGNEDDDQASVVEVAKGRRWLE